MILLSFQIKIKKNKLKKISKRLKNKLKRKTKMKKYKQKMALLIMISLKNKKNHI